MGFVLIYIVFTITEISQNCNLTMSLFYDKIFLSGSKGFDQKFVAYVAAG